MARLFSSDFDFALEGFRFAEFPRPASEHRLLVHNVSTNANSHLSFSDIGDVLNPGDLLVINNSRVFPASLYLDDASFLLFVDPIHDSFTDARVICPFKPAVGAVFSFDFARIRLFSHEPGWDVYHAHISPHSNFDSLAHLLQVHGRIPMPIYLKRIPSAADEHALQNVYSCPAGSIAPPVAGLHFSSELLASLAARSIQSAPVTLHVGYGTFRSFKTEFIDQHTMDSEAFHVPASTLNAIVRTKASGRRVVAVGTTAARVLETISPILGHAPPGGFHNDIDSSTSIFIYPPYTFSVVDGLITNFQYPRLPVLAMAAAFCGLEPLRQVYHEAVSLEYLFYSYGDAMLLIREPTP